MIIYKLISPSNKVYVGLSIITIEERFLQHIKAWKLDQTRDGRYGSKLYAAFEKYPPEEWIREVIEETDDPMRECYWIEYYDSVNNGYNTLLGGQTGWAGVEMTDEHKQNMSEARKEFYETEQGQEWK